MLTPDTLKENWRKTLEDEWFSVLMEGARTLLLKGEEPKPCAFLREENGDLGVVMLALDKEEWATALRYVVAETEAESVALISTGWMGGAPDKNDPKLFRVMPHDDPLRQPTAIFTVKNRGEGIRMFMCPFDQVGDDGPVTWCGEWKEWTAEGEVTSRFLDNVFDGRPSHK